MPERPFRGGPGFPEAPSPRGPSGLSVSGGRLRLRRRPAGSAPDGLALPRGISGYGPLWHCGMGAGNGGEWAGVLTFAPS
ncbi:hypothetical protein RADP37_04637 [Roseomonas mucosa]|uniref:Uncharacterized protein n=1 Tax=Roseomonas mucosa TaxID=207340 RepID=A0A4Y1N2H0_9PROT|nr:hypothetical protein RADP37_04637 [Roseomonas mucosa]